MDYEKILSNVFQEVKAIPNQGKVATYIPELGSIDPNKFGVHFSAIADGDYSFGDAHEKFSIQSIAKVLALVLAYRLEDEELWKRVGVEPSGTSFNSLIQLEADQGIPRNPLINAGALVVCDVLCSRLVDPQKDFIAFVRELSGIEGIAYNPKIAASEKSCGYRNSALINLMKDLGNIKNKVDDVLDFYFHLCSIEMTCAELAQTFLLFTNNGKNNFKNERVINEVKSKRINAIMQMCGFYDEAGEFAFKVGLPGKSGVGGGIVAILPEEYSIVVWSPCLNKSGNSYKGLKFLERFTTETGHSIF